MCIYCFLQEGCCGAFNHSDYNRFDDWKTGIYQGKTVPLSCCTKISTATGDTPNSASDFQDLQKCIDGDTTYINSKVFDIIALTELTGIGIISI